MRLFLEEQYRERLNCELKKRLKRTPIADCHYEKEYDKDDKFCFGCTKRCWIKPLEYDRCRYMGQGGGFALGVQSDEQCIVVSQGKNQEQIFQQVHNCVEEFFKREESPPKIPVWCEGHLPIRSITVGPCTDQKEVEESIAHYCKHVFWLRDVEIKRSNIPFRRAH